MSVEKTPNNPDIPLSRYFNRLEIHNREVIKKSANKSKLYAEFQYYQLVPQQLKTYMVEPYGYADFGHFAQYTMKRVSVPDLAWHWVRAKINKTDFVSFMNAAFHYLNSRPRRTITKTESEKLAHDIYIAKVQNRIKNYIDIVSHSAKQHNELNDIDKTLKLLYYRYLGLYKKYYVNSAECVIGHGDFCLSNMFFDGKKLLLIDPRGATSETELWTDLYYDIAKLSHSILGNYDFFNEGHYSVTADKVLAIDVNDGLNGYRQIFLQYLRKNNYDYHIVRLLEAGLFLSMLPLHINDLRKTLGFILNAQNIITELENV